MDDFPVHALTSDEQAQVVLQQLKTLEADYLAKSLMRRSLDDVVPSPPPADEAAVYAFQLDVELKRLTRAISVHRDKLQEIEGSRDGA